MNSKRTVLVLTSDPDGPVVRHRFRYFEPALRDAGIALEIGAWPKVKSVRRETFARAAAVDAVVVSSRLLTKGDTKKLRRTARRLGFDFDDALPFTDSTRGAQRSGTRAGRFEAIVRHADRVTAGNRYLAGLAREAGREPVVLPTVVDVRGDVSPPVPESPPTTLGWIGSRATLPYLEGAADPLAAIAASGRDIRVRVIADATPHLPGVDVEFVPWAPDTWRDALAGIHIGLAPLPDDAWTRGKCGLKLLQVQAAGRPVVAAPVGVQVDQVVDGETGLLAPDDAGFEHALARLVDDGDLRRVMGERAFASVRADWSVDAWADAFVAEIEALLAGVRSGAA